MSVKKIEINTKKLFESNLSIESYFILYCLVNSYKELIEDYVKINGKIDRLRFEELERLKYIELNINDNNENIVFNNIKITQNGINIIGFEKLDHDRYFNELKQVYPKKAGIRSLHKDNIRSRKLYKDIVTSEELHKKILKCIELYVNEHKRSNSIEYLQLLPTFLQQRNYEQYIDYLDENEDDDIKTNITLI